MGVCGHFESGVTAFDQKKYQQAAKDFNAYIIENPTDHGAFFNLGLSYHKAEDFGKAVWAFEKALKLKPNDNATFEQLENTYFAIHGEYGYEAPFSSLNLAIYSFSGNTWGIIAITFSIVCMTMIFLYTKTQITAKKKFFALFCFGSILGLAIATIFAFKAANFHSTSTYGIVTRKEINTYNAGGEKLNNKFNAGQRLNLIHSENNGFYEVESPLNETLFIRIEDLELI